MSKEIGTINSIQIGENEHPFDAGFLNGKNTIQTKSNLVRVLSEDSTSEQYPSAKCIYTMVGDLDVFRNNVITYKTTDESTINPTDGSITGSVLTIKSNKYSNGIGKIIYDGDVHGIGDNAFTGCTQLSEITLPSSINTVGENIFSNNNENLEKINLAPKTLDLIKANPNALQSGKFNIYNKSNGNYIETIEYVSEWNNSETWGTNKIIKIN